MKKDYRVRKNEDFGVIIRKKQSIASKTFIIYYLKNDIDHARVGISVSKKLGNAVVRNKIKRQIRMMVQDVFDFDNKYDYIVIVRNNYLNNNFESNKKDMLYLYNKMIKRTVK